jgi:hypothetical protein
LGEYNAPSKFYFSASLPLSPSSRGIVFLDVRPLGEMLMVTS